MFNEIVRKERGFFTVHDKWTNDHSKDYFEGFMNTYFWPVAKILVLFSIGSTVQILFGIYWVTSLCCIMTTYWYQHLLALFICNTIAMPAMDHQCFFSAPGAMVNYMNCTKFDEWNESMLVENLIDMFKLLPKFRYKIKEIAGDYYYEMIPLQEAVEKILIRPESEEKILRSQDDINQFIADNMNEKLPMDGP